MARNYIKNQYSEQEFAELLKQCRLSGLTVCEIANKFNIGERTAQRYLSKYGFTKQSKLDISISDVADLYNNGFTANEIAIKYNISCDSVTKRLKQAGIKLSKNDNIVKHFKRVHSLLWPDIKADLDSGLSKTKVAAKYHIRIECLYRLMRDMSYQKDFVGDISAIEQILIDSDNIINNKLKTSTKLYMNAILEYVSTYKTLPTMSSLARFMGKSVQTVSSWFECHSYQYLLSNSAPSYLVSAVISVLNDYNIKYELNNRKIINPYEIDIYIPDLKTGIEINPSVSHCTDNKRRMGNKSITYHQKKSLMSLQSGVKLIHIYDWDLDNLQMIIHDLLSETLIPDKDTILLDLDKPKWHIHDLINSGFMQDMICEPRLHLVHEYTHMSMNIETNHSLHVYDAGMIVYKKSKVDGTPCAVKVACTV